MPVRCRNRLPLAAALLLLLPLLAACDGAGVDEEVAYFAGTWAVTDVAADGTTLTALALARYDDVLLTFTTEARSFALLGDLSGTADDLLISGRYQLDDDTIVLLSPALYDPLVFTYERVGDDRVVLVSEPNRDLLPTLFALDLAYLDEVVLGVARRLD